MNRRSRGRQKVCISVSSATSVALLVFHSVPLVKFLITFPSFLKSMFLEKELWTSISKVKRPKLVQVDAMVVWELCDYLWFLWKAAGMVPESGAPASQCICLSPPLGMLLVLPYTSPPITSSVCRVEDPQCQGVQFNRFLKRLSSKQKKNQ